MSNPSSFDTAVRGVVMLVVVGGGAWGALQYPPIRARAQDLLAKWESGTLLRASHDNLAEVRVQGGDAPPFSSTSSAPEPASPPAALSFDERPQPLAPKSQPLAPNSQPLAPNSQPASLYAGQQVDYHRDAEPGFAVRPAENLASGALPAVSMADLEARLSQLGATYCLLERWQSHPPRYRFHCRVQLSAGVEPRRFEFSGPEPARLMQQAADAVEACRAERIR